MEQSTINLIEQSGLKKKHIAKQIGVKPSMLSMAIGGERTLSPDKEAALKLLLNKAVA